jgi:very-long-chain (3R)-3-hydroxyacyl-CoA dehydratase
MAKSTPTAPKRSGFGPKKAYLVLYNAASAVAWAAVLGRVVAAYSTDGAEVVPAAVDNFARITQTFAVMEILHALTGKEALPPSSSRSKLTSPPHRRCPGPLLYDCHAGC